LPLPTYILQPSLVTTVAAISAIIASTEGEQPGLVSSAEIPTVIPQQTVSIPATVQVGEAPHPPLPQLVVSIDNTAARISPNAITTSTATTSSPPHRLSVSLT